MADVKLVKSKYTDTDVTSLGELTSADNAKIPGTIEVTGHTKFEGVTSTGATGTGKIVYDTSPTLVTPALGTPASGALTNCTGYPSASTTVTGISELATTDETITGTDTARTTTPAGVAGAMAVQTNPKAMAQGIAMTYAASGSSGITVQNNDNLNFGTGNFTLRWKGALPDWTPASNVVFLSKYVSLGGGNYTGLEFYLPSAAPGKISLWVGRADTGTLFHSVSNHSLIDGTEHEIVMVVTRETASVAGSMQIYIDGAALGTATTIPATATVSISNSANLSICSGASPSARAASTSKSFMTFNRALSAAEVLDLYNNGIPFADKWGSQSNRITGNNVDFSTDAANEVAFNAAYTWQSTGTIDSVAVASNVLSLQADDNAGIFHAALIPKDGKYYAIRLNVTAISGTWNVQTRQGGTFTTHATITTTGTKIIEFIAPSGTVAGTYLGVYLRSASTNATIEISAGTITNEFRYVGATLALEPEGIQPAPGQWLDSSSNKLHAWQPATGSSLTRYKNTFEIRGINTWAGTHEAQSIAWATDASKAILPAGCYIDSIIGVITGATIEDIIIGDGSDTDRWVEATTGLAAGTVAFTIANHISDGTNYEMVVDPDANFTGSIEWTIRGTILD